MTEPKENDRHTSSRRSGPADCNTASSWEATPSTGPNPLEAAVEDLRPQLASFSVGGPCSSWVCGKQVGSAEPRARLSTPTPPMACSAQVIEAAELSKCTTGMGSSSFDTLWASLMVVVVAAVADVH